MRVWIVAVSEWATLRGRVEGRPTLLQDGKGTYTQAKGVFYEGRYQKGVKHGCGLMKLANGTLQQQEFTNGDLVRTWEPGLMQKLFNTTPFG
jgi:hypothetical protein